VGRIEGLKDEQDASKFPKYTLQGFRTLGGLLAVLN